MRLKNTLFSFGVVASCLVAPMALADNTDGIIHGKVVIDEVDGISKDQQQALADELMGKFPSLTLSPSGLEKETKIEIGSLPDDEVDEVISYLKHHTGIQHVERLYEQHAYGLVNLAHPNDPLYDSKQWNMKTIEAEKAWGFTQGQGVTVAVVDTGIDCNLEDLKGTTCKSGWNFVSDTDDATDDQSHGSHCAGTIAQATNNNIGAAGVGSKISLLAIKVLSASGSGSDVDVANGIRYAADHGANVISLSLGGSHNSAVQQDAVDHAISLGVVVIAANGNSGGPIGYPAAIPGVLAVSATDSNNVVASFSSRGPETFIGAPGVGITQQTICEGGNCPNFPSFNGTSMATPHVAGVAALLMSQGVTDPLVVKARLADSATKTLKSRMNHNEYGAGIVNAGQAVADESFHQAFYRLLFLGLISFFALDRKDHKSSWKFFLPAVMAGVGLFFLPMLVSFPSSLTFAITRPLLELTGLFSVKVTSFMPYCAALLPAVLMATTWHKQNLRMSVAGVAAGAAAYLSQQLWNGSLLLPFGGPVGWVVLSLNVALCLYMARFNLKHLTSPTDKPVSPDVKN
jgi:serine protease